MYQGNWRLFLVIVLAACLAACSPDDTLGSNQTEDDTGSSIDTSGDDRMRLDVFLDGTGDGVVVSTPAGVDCGDACNPTFARGTQVKLTAIADNGSGFAGWSGACSGTDTTCTVVMNSRVEVGATFDCSPQCDGRDCGRDNCGGSCGTCSGNRQCSNDGICVDDCTPDCSGRECGSSCGQSCGSCDSDQFCDQAGTCIDNCTPNCSGRDCGTDGCDGSCGSCGSGQSCTSSGVCVDDCTPQCSGKECGDDGCGGSCGSCDPDQSCQSGACVCTPQCSGKECGDDGCGGSCGDCPDTQVCETDGTCGCKDGAIDHAGICDFWVLESNSNDWIGYNFDSASQSNAPSRPVQAAFDIEHDNLAFVFTEDHVHKFRPSDHRWLDKQSLSSFEPGLTSVTLRWAQSYAGDPGDSTEDALIVGTSGSQMYVWFKTYHLSTGDFTIADPDLHGSTHEWTSSKAPSNYSSVRAAWLDSHNSRQWINANPSSMCNTSATQVDSYTTKVTSTTVYIRENQHCPEWLDPESATSFGPFNQQDFAGVPPITEIGASFWHQGDLFIFRD